MKCPNDRAGSQHASGRMLAGLDEVDLRALSRSLSDDLRERKVTFGAANAGNVEAFVVDPVPRVIERNEWDALAAGLAQRAESLERFALFRRLVRACEERERPMSLAGSTRRASSTQRAT